MEIDLNGSDPVFTRPGHRSAEILDGLLVQARRELGIGEDREWRVTSSRLKLTKIFFEIEERSSVSSRRLIGKVSHSRNANSAYEKMRLLWAAGMRPPSKYTVPEPVAFVATSALLLQEKAPGMQLLEKIRSGAASAEDANGAADWLAALQSLPVTLERAAPGFNLERCRRELPDALPDHAARIAALLDDVSHSLEEPAAVVPSHGDFHPMNVYTAPDRVTAIDLDTLAAREPAADAGYFVAQSAIMGYLVLESFEATAAFRSAFLERYAGSAPHPCGSERLALYVALAFIRSLHYDFCILHTNPHALVEPFVSAAEQCLVGGEIRLAA
jgi:hypothetical protein